MHYHSSSKDSYGSCLLFLEKSFALGIIHLLEKRRFMHILRENLTSGVSSRVSSLLFGHTAHVLTFHIRIELGFRKEQCTDDNYHEYTHDNGARGQLTVIEVGKCIIHKMLKHV